MSVVEKLTEYWASKNIPSNAGATPDSIRSFEVAHRAAFPEDFREYLLRLNGLATFGAGTDPQGFGFLPLRRIRPVAEEEYPAGYEGRGYFVFAEYLDWSWAYAIRLADEDATGEVIHILTLQPKRVAPSFTAFIDLYLVDSPELYPATRNA